MVKVLCVHGVGHAEASLAWQDMWKQVIQTQLQAAHPDGVGDVSFDFMAYDDDFAPVLAKLSPSDIASAVVKLGEGVMPWARPRAFADFSDEARWSAGMVVAWVENDGLRQQVWQKFIADVDAFQPDVICAHSLGSLIAYDGFRRQEEKIAGRTLLTFGSQLGNFFVRGAFGGQVKPFAPAAFWHHLYNQFDHVFTAALDFDAFRTAANFHQVETDFGRWMPWPLNHDAVDPGAPDHAYLSHPQTRAQVWSRIPTPQTVPALTRAIMEPAAARILDKVPDAPTRRALLVGINAYPDPANHLEGCVNDVFQMSAILQECGFAAEDIRVVLDDRATASAITERMHWLLDGTAKGDQRFFYYSGHGAQLPQYGPDGKVRRIDACLVPYDFAWTPETAITDDALVNFYSQLPFEAHFLMMLDSCYSGGMTRGGVRARGLNPPDDIRHRMLRWDAAQELWVAREMPPTGGGAPSDEDGDQRSATRQLGSAGALRTLSRKRYLKLRAALHHGGPYMPVVYEACGPNEYAYEYQDGVISRGAFTYTMTLILRRHGREGRLPTFNQLLRETAKTLKQTLHYDQTPVVRGPEDVLEEAVPWLGDKT